MKSILLAALLAGASTTAVAAKPDRTAEQAPQAAKSGDASAKANPAKGEEFDLAKMMAVFDKIFPPQPDPPQGRLALARSTAAGVLPDGTYAAIFDDVMSGVVDRVLSISAGDFGGKEPPEAGANLTLREQLAKDDPHFDERMRIMRRVIGEELVKIAAVVEPKLREGLARSIARRFEEGQLREINAFLSTDAGRAFGRQSMRLWVDPDVMRSMFQSFPDLFAAMPGAMKRLEAETAHLPKPPKKTDEKDDAPPDAEEDDADADASDQS